MSLRDLVPNPLSTAAGTAGLSFPVWAQLLSSGWNLIVGFLGGVFLILCIKNEWLKSKKHIRDLDKKP